MAYEFGRGHEPAIMSMKFAMNMPAILLALFMLAMCSCSRPARGDATSGKFSVGFWYWGNTSDKPSPSSYVADSIFVHAGRMNPPDNPLNIHHASKWEIYEDLPRNLPPASEYWMVYRNEAQLVPGAEVTGKLIDSIWKLWGEARRRHLNVTGIQLDIDSPTAKLHNYATFLSNTRKRLPPGCRLSITALLDWFRSGTAVGEVVRQVDEFVPQFYDIAEPSNPFRQSAIAAKIDFAKWGPVFNRFDKPYRIGISTFGRARSLPADPRQFAYLRRHTSALGSFYSDLTPLDLGIEPSFRLTARNNEAGELMLDYRASRLTASASGNLKAGDVIEFIIATPETVHSAVQSARKMGGHCAGIVFFRWPARNETLVMQPDEALAAAGLEPSLPDRPVEISQIDGNCAAVKCADIYLVNAKPWAPNQARYRIHASNDFDYFIPEIKSLVRLSSPSQLEVTFPPYTGRGSVFLGRAVSRESLQYTVEPLDD
jgi:hypothetical protein